MQLSVLFKQHFMKDGATGGGAYCLGFIGALVYFYQQSIGFESAVIGLLKAIVWPAFLVYKLFGFLG